MEDSIPAEEQRHEYVNGVDVTMVRWMLSLTPLERLEVLQRHVRSILELCAAIGSDSRICSRPAQIWHRKATSS